jgi:hypothetical protein
MTIAIQNLSQLERTKSMKFYKEVITSNCKTVLVFGDTNREDSEYWSTAFGKFEYWNLGSSATSKPLSNVEKEEPQKETTSMGIDFSQNIHPFHLSELPFRTLFYRTRDAKGNQIFGKGVTDFLEKRYLKKFNVSEYNFEPYINYNPEDSMIREKPVVKGIVDTEIEMNDALAGIKTEEEIKQLEKEREEMQALYSAENAKMAELMIDEPEFIDEVVVEIEKKI